MILNDMPIDLLLILSEYLLEPPIYITNIGWNNLNQYRITIHKKEFYKKLNYYINIIKYQISYFNISNIYSLYKIINNYNKAFRKFTPTYIFIDNIFIKYPYLPHNLFISKEFQLESNIKKLEIELEVIHTFYLKNLYNCVIKELNYFINKYNKFTKRYIINHNDLINLNYYFLYPFYMYIFDIMPFYI